MSITFWRNMYHLYFIISKSLNQKYELGSKRNELESNIEYE